MCETEKRGHLERERKADQDPDLNQCSPLI